MTRGKSGLALAGTEYRLIPSACRLIVQAYRLLPWVCWLPIELRKLRNQMKQFANPGGILASLPFINLSHWALHVESFWVTFWTLSFFFCNSVCTGIFNKIHYLVLEKVLTLYYMSPANARMSDAGQPFWNLQFRYFVLPCTNTKVKYSATWSFGPLLPLHITPEGLEVTDARFFQNTVIMLLRSPEDWDASPIQISSKSVNALWR